MTEIQDEHGFIEVDNESNHSQDFDDDEQGKEDENITDLFDVIISDPTPADKRAHHNALERKRRDHIKDSFSKLQRCVPQVTDDKASRAQILKKATSYIMMLKGKNRKHQGDIESMRHHNKSMEQHVTALEKIKATSKYVETKNLLGPPAPPAIVTPTNTDIDSEKLEAAEAAATGFGSVVVQSVEESAVDEPTNKRLCTSPVAADSS